MNYIKKETTLKQEVDFINHLPDISIKKAKEEIINGLKAFPKYISPKFFYDERGSELFEKITMLDEYYPTRTEKSILSSIVKNLNLDFTNLNIIELGSGDPSKIKLLLQQIPDKALSTIKYYPVDISQSAIEQSVEILSEVFPSIKINGIVSDFLHQLILAPSYGKRLFCFFGSTIGNLNPDERDAFMKLLGKEMKIGDNLLLGVDLVKDTEILEIAYNDEQKITAAFNKNILCVVNDIARTNFNSNDFDHFSLYNKFEKRIEMHLKANEDIIVNFDSDIETIKILKGETIHTENSYKFDNEEISKLAKSVNLDVVQSFTDERNWFSLVYYQKTKN